MFHRKIKYGIILLLLVLVVIIGYIVCFSVRSDELRVIFLDVGQGDAILISRGSYQMLIDGGRDGKLLLEKLGKYVPFWDRNIEVVLATHPDQDHIAGLIDVIKRYNVQTIIKTQDKSETQTYKKLEEIIDNEKAKNIVAKSGTKINFSEKSEAEIIYPFFETGDVLDNKSNSKSVTVRFKAGENVFLLAGDLPKEQEQEIINSGFDISAGFLKISHHGSKYSTSREFLEKINPQKAIISVGKDNAYGHPNQEVLDVLNEGSIEVLRTDEKGDIIFNCREDLICDKIQ